MRRDKIREDPRRVASLANEKPSADIRPRGGHVTFPAAVKPRRLISFIPRVVSTNYELAPAIIKKYNFAARAARSSLNALTISYPPSLPPPGFPRRYARVQRIEIFTPLPTSLLSPTKTVRIHTVVAARSRLYFTILFYYRACISSRVIPEFIILIPYRLRKTIQLFNITQRE